MAKAPYDYDITTNALPLQVKKLFEDDFKVIETGLKHGTVTLFRDVCNSVEVTTYRVDGEYLDNRHPENVHFTRNLQEDLSRRDFTVNAMVYCKQTGVLDLFGGKDDIKNHIIRCIGNPEKRFSEDALRMLRALRFSAKLEFEIEKNTSDAIKKLYPLLKNVAYERSYKELTMLFEYASVSKLNDILMEYKELFKLIFNITVDDEKYKSICHNTSQICNYNCKSRFFYFIIAISQKYEDLCLNIDMLKISNREKNIILATDFFLKRIDVHSDKSKLKKLLRRYDEMLYITASKHIADIIGENDFTKNIDEIVSNKECVRISQLDISGNDLISELGINGIQIGDTLNILLDLVIDGKTDNIKSDLLAAAREL